jgi:hypothetical protein
MSVGNFRYVKDEIDIRSESLNIEFDKTQEKLNKQLNFCENDLKRHYFFKHMGNLMKINFI